MTEPNEQVKSGNLTERVARDLRRKLMRGEIAPGAQIEAGAVAERFGTSRIPVRDALARLAADGLVVIEPYKRARAVSLDATDLAERYEVRATLEALAIEKSVGLVTSADLDRIRELRLIVEADPADVEEAVIADENFHMACYEPSGSQHLTGLIRRLWHETRLYRATSWKNVTEEVKSIVFKEHELIEQSMRDGQPGLARELTRVHLGRTRSRLLRQPDLFVPPNSTVNSKT